MRASVRVFAVEVKHLFVQQVFDFLVARC